MPLSLDAREVLRHLNEMGYCNITAEQLKEFLKDLRKLIKYEERLGVLKQPKERCADRFEQLSKALTASYRAKVQACRRAVSPCPKLKGSPWETTTKKSEKTTRKKITTKKPETAPPPSQHPCRKQKTEKVKTPTTQGRVCADSAENKSSRMWIRPKSSASVGGKCDPVRLYHYYCEEWKKYRSNLPGEDSRTDLRWNVRQKLLGA